VAEDIGDARKTESWKTQSGQSEREEAAQRKLEALARNKYSACRKFTSKCVRLKFWTLNQENPNLNIDFSGSGYDKF
jgi:hypothetical protein